MNLSSRLAVTASSLSSDPRLVPTLARQLNLPGLLFDAYTRDFSIPDLSQTGRREFQQVLRNQDRRIVGLRVDLGQYGLSAKADIDQQLSRLERAMDSAAGLMSPLLCVDLGPLPTPPKVRVVNPKVTPDMAGLILLPTAFDTTEAPPEEPQSPADAAFITHLDPVMYELGQRADRYGVMLAFRSELASFAAVERTVQAAACPWFGFDLDPVALMRDGAELDATFARVGPLIRHVRARDAVLGTGHRTQPAVIGKGGVDWTHFLTNLHAADYHGWMTIDPVELSDRMAATAAGAGYLVKISAN